MRTGIKVVSASRYSRSGLTGSRPRWLGPLLSTCSSVWSHCFQLSTQVQYFVILFWETFAFACVDIKIKMRHTFLVTTFGTKPEEDLSYRNSNMLMITATICMFIFCSLEITIYYLYNRKVSCVNVNVWHIRMKWVLFQFHPWVKIVKGEVVNYNENSGKRTEVWIENGGAVFLFSLYDIDICMYLISNLIIVLEDGIASILISVLIICRAGKM